MMFVSVRRHRCLLAVAIILFLSIIQLVWFAADPPSTPKYDAKHIQLLRDYQARHSRKINNNVLILSPEDEDIAPIQGYNEKISSFPQKKTNLSQLVVLPAESSIEHNKPTSLSDIYIAVKTTKKFHESRVQLLLDTWIPLARQSTHLITDEEDANMTSQFEHGHYHKASCTSSHFRSGLVCKVSVAYDLFLQNPKRWFCIADDDTYINIPNLLSLLQKHDHTDDFYIGRPSLNHPIRVTVDGYKVAFWFHTGGAGYCISRGLALKMSTHAAGGRLRELADKLRVPDDVVVGYIVNKLMDLDLTREETFHSHLEGLWRLNPNDLKNQITLSYGQFTIGPPGAKKETIQNVINTHKVIPTFSPEIDPTRLRSVHCYLFPHARECSKFGPSSV